ncbi:hypothetical protein B0H16DRAFT_1330696, partial [Mycena metata]
VEHEGTDRHGAAADDSGVCTKCVPNVTLEANGQRVLEHMGGHILFDPAFSSAVQQPCGICGRSYGLCKLHFKSSRGTSAARQIDWARSTCGSPMTFNMAYASVSKDADSPCSNHAVQCSLCDKIDPLVWTYNLAAHWQKDHGRPSGPATYKSGENHVEYKMGKNELKWMKVKWNNRFQKSKTTKNKSKSKHSTLQISVAHKSSMALRCVAKYVELSPSQPCHLHLLFSDVASENAAINSTQELRRYV